MTVELRTMDTPKRLGRSLSICIVAAALILGAVVVYLTNHYPRTDDAEILANFIGIAPQVDGPIVHLNVRDNQFVTRGTLLFEIDDRPYRYALAQALSEQAALKDQMADERRRFAALVSVVSASAASIEGSHADLGHWEGAGEQAGAQVASAEEGVQRARAEWSYASNNLRRLEPLLSRQFVTVDQVDRARMSEVAQAQALKQAESQLQQAQAGLTSMRAQFARAQAALGQSKAAHQQAQNAVTTLEPLTGQRGARQAAVDTARYHLENCRVSAPFDARAVNLTISEGAYAHVGQQMFTLIDARTWWAIGNFREGQLKRITPGMKADVYVMSRPNVRLAGTVDSVGFGVTPDPDRIGRLAPGLQYIPRP